MKKLKVFLILLLFLSLVFVVCFFGPFILWSFTDSSWYYSEKVNLGPVDYNAELVKAKEAGYTIKGSWPWPGSDSSGFSSEGVEEVKEKFGNATIVQEVRLCYGRNSELTVCKYGKKPETYLVFSNKTNQDLNSSLQLSHFPEEKWMIEKIGFLFNISDDNSRKYLEELEKAAQNQTWDAKIQVNESLDFPLIYDYLKKNSKSSNSDITVVLTKGSDAEEIFFNGSKLGCIKYFIPQAEVETFDKGNEYTIKLSASGDVGLQIIMPLGSSGDKIPEEEYRAVFKEMFKNMGLPQEAVDRFEFTYSSSRVW
jgi:hypothetical protein